MFRAPFRLLGYTPRGMFGDAYSGSLSKVLTSAAAAKGYTSPYWVTAAGAQKACLLIPSGEEGVTVHDLGAPIVFYNVQQGVSQPKATGSEGRLTHNTISSSASVVEHRTVTNKQLSREISRKCDDALRSTGGSGNCFWGTHKELLMLGLRLKQGARPLVDNLFNLEQCEDPTKALAIVRRQFESALRTLDGGVLPRNASVDMRSKIEALKLRASLITRLLPNEFALANTLSPIINMTPRYCGTEKEMACFGTRLRGDTELYAALALLDAAGTTRVTSSLQLRNIYSRALEGNFDINVVRRLISASPEGVREPYFPVDLSSNPELFTPNTCSRFLSPILPNTNYIVAPRAAVDSDVPNTSPKFTNEDVRNLLSYRIAHRLFNSRAWVDASLAQFVKVGDFQISSLHGVVAEPCILPDCGSSFYNLEQLHGFETVRDFEECFFQHVVDDSDGNERH